MDKPETVQVTESVIITATTTATEDGVTTIFNARPVGFSNEGWTSTDLDQVIQWTRGFLGANIRS